MESKVPFDPQAESNFYGLVWILQHSTIKSCLMRVNQAGPIPSGLVCTNCSDKTSVLLINSWNVFQDLVEFTCVGK